MAVFALAGLAAAEVPAQAREASYNFDLPAGPLTASIARFSQITGLSVGYPGDLPMVMARRVSGTFPAESALRKLLDGTRLRAVKVGPGLYRLERKAKRADVAPAAAPPPAAVAGPDIIVTGQKRQQALSAIPLSVSVMSAIDMGKAGRSLGSRDMSLDMEGLAMTNLGPGRNRQFIRGVADSPFNGQSQATVAVQVDEARVTFNAPDPDLRLIDVDRIEILKGPQGPLYGSGALGGIYHIVTRRPDPTDSEAWVRLSGSAVEHGRPGHGVEAMLNLPLVGDRLAVRAVGYDFLDGGWIDSGGVRKDSNSTHSAGLRLAVRWQPSDRWTLDAGYWMQNIDSRDSQYVTGTDDRLRRQSRIAEPTDNDFRMAHAAITGELGGLELLSATSYVEQRFSYTLDASASAAFFGLTGQARFDDARRYSVLNQEFRLSEGRNSRWVAGASMLRAMTREQGAMTGEDGMSRNVEDLRRVVSEYALFGEGSIRLARGLDATLGMRLFYSLAKDDARADRAEAERLRKSRKWILSPSLALSYTLPGEGLLFLRYARAMRPGGLAPAGMTASGHFDADELGTFDLGYRKSFWDNRLSVSAGAYYTLWDEIQSDYLLRNGLVSTRNAGRGRIVGLEGSADWRMGGGFALSLGGSVQDARLLRSEAGQKLADRRLPVAPEITGRVSLSRHYRIGSWNGQSALQANYIGDARLSFDDDLDRGMGDYTVMSASSSVERGPWSLAVRIDNLFDVRGDSFAFGNPFSIREAPQYTPLAPRTLTLSLARRW
ncbi:TonB-dependent receptor [Sphingobium sp. LB126]|uniref:TonB-dependent receptor domain-containing protein n=1 Tax=Sphingobium sp. LB126 TaxID=1983755 RepID=UPI000C20D382|nr:TonB-dependent receptor [Sphingobium sp. LB126]PJG45981.1 TonB-dependent receptor [Sphingobium sp. LB126]